MAALTEEKEKEVSQYKVVLLGDRGVGKTALILWYLERVFSPSENLTVGASVHFKRLSCDGKEVKLEIWDTAGQERYASLGPIHCRNAKAVIICYDISSEPSFESVKSWVSHPFIPDSVVMVLVGCKADRSQCRVVERAVGEAKAKTVHPAVQLHFFETSVVMDQNVDELFNFIALQLVNTGIKKDESNSVRLQPDSNNVVTVCNSC